MGTSPVDFRQSESLDEIVSHSATVLAEQIQAAAAWAKSEMDLQIEVAGALKEFAKRAQIKLEVHHNVTVATGRPDSVYGSVIVEYKNPGTLSATKDAAPNKAVIDQLKQRFYDMRREENRKWPSMFGVGTDGKYFIFLRFRDDKWTDQEPLEINRYSAERFLWALYNLGQKGKPYQPEYLHGDFGSESSVAQEGVRALYDEILATDNPKAEVLFSQWKILFGEVCGYDVENLSDKLKKLAEFYVVKGKPQAAPLLFAVHTYYAILIKLLAAEIVSFFNPWMPRQVEKLQSATTSAKLRRELQELERGGIFHQMGITNFLEGDLFSWYLDAWSDPVEALVRKMITKLDEYNPGTFSEDPAQSRDLLKRLYQQLFPKSVRHDLGEYYTPDWLAEHVLNELGYEGDPDKRLLDPACGSGTFLVMAINRIRHWYDLNREKCAYDEGELLKRILANVVGFDLNPLAVMAARTNYLVAIKDLVRHVDHVEIPVYLCDSIMTPAEYGDLFTGGQSTVAKVPCSAMKPPHLLVPKEIAKSPKEVAKYADVLEQCVKNAYDPEEFLSRCRDEGLKITANDAHLDLYKELVKLDKANKNGIWARIIKNNFAPLFVGRVDYVAGNPPWVFWNNLPTEYRKQVKRLMVDTYGISAGSASTMKRLGSAGKDISILFVYVCLDDYLLLGGKLGFVITQTVFQSTASDEFRRFLLPGGVPFRIEKVDDWVKVSPFTSAANKTATFVAVKGEETQYPVKYISWTAKADFDRDSASLEEVRMCTQAIDQYARPSDNQRPQSLWLIGQGNNLKQGNAAHKYQYEVRRGIETGLESAFRVRILSSKGKEIVIVENVRERARKPLAQVHGAVEISRMYPYITGSTIARWNAWSPACYIVPHTPDTGMKPIEESVMKKVYPHTYEFLRQFREDLEDRGIHKRWGKGNCFYSLYDIGPYTFSEWKVVWKRTTQNFEAAVVSSLPVTQSHHAIVVPNGKVMMVPFEESEAAHFLCSLLNSSVARSRINSGLTSEAHAEVLNFLPLTSYSHKDRIHNTLANLSRQCHLAAGKGAAEELAELEAKVDKAAAKLWGISDAELEESQKALTAKGNGRRRQAKSHDEDE
jgi:SAM-dependent methyltransferase